MTQTEAPIIINAVGGHLVAAGPAAIIRAALRGTQPLTITKKATGDIVWLAPHTEQVWRDDAVTVDTTDIARTVQHPIHGEIIYAWVDSARLDDAPHVAERERQVRAQFAQAALQADRRARAMVPACDNCGDCHLCV